MKMCKKCKIVERDTAKSALCKACRKEYLHQNHLRNREQRLLGSKRRNLQNKEKMKEHRLDLIRQGICGACGVTPLSTRSMCAECAKKVLNSTAAYRRTKAGAWRECLKSAKCRAKLGNRLFDLDIDWLLDLYNNQEGRCLVSGMLLDFESDFGWNTMHPRAPSLDRIDATRGYTKDNVRLVCAQVNIALGKWGNAYFYEMCRKVLERNPNEAIGI